MVFLLPTGSLEWVSWVHYEKSLICGGGYLLLRTIISEDATSDLCVSIIFDMKSFLCLCLIPWANQ